MVASTSHPGVRNPQSFPSFKPENPQKMNRTTGRRPQTSSQLDQEVRLPQNSRSHPLDRPRAPQPDQVHVIIDHRSTDPQNQTRPPPQTTGRGPNMAGLSYIFPLAKGEKGRVRVSSSVPDTLHHPKHQELHIKHERSYVDIFSRQSRRSLRNTRPRAKKNGSTQRSLSK